MSSLARSDLAGFDAVGTADWRSVIRLPRFGAIRFVAAPYASCVNCDRLVRSRRALHASPATARSAPENRSCAGSRRPAARKFRLWSRPTPRAPAFRSAARTRTTAPPAPGTATTKPLAQPIYSLQTSPASAAHVPAQSIRNSIWRRCVTSRRWQDPPLRLPPRASRNSGAHSAVGARGRLTPHPPAGRTSPAPRPTFQNVSVGLTYRSFRYCAWGCFRYFGGTCSALALRASAKEPSFASSSMRMRRCRPARAISGLVVPTAAPAACAWRARRCTRQP